MDINEFKEFMDVSEFKSYFVAEAGEHLQKMNDNLLALEKDPANKSLLKELMRSSHTIKGSAATMAYNKVAYLAHILEDVFDSASNDDIQITPALIAELLKGADAIENSVRSIDQTGREIDLTDISEKIKKLTGVSTEGVGKSLRQTKEVPVAASAAKIPTVETISHVKVPVSRLDSLLSLAEEIMLIRMQLDQLKNNYLPLKNVAERFGRLVSELQYQVMKARLIALDQVFARFPRMVHDLASSTGKTVNFEISGGEIELDRTIVDELGEPLIHLLRNAVDHGIDKTGTVTLSAVRVKDRALISVENSGNVIDFNKVREKAVEKGIVSAETAAKMTQDQLTALLFANRLSTSREITEISGRGVGLGIVKNFADEIGGRVIVTSPVKNGQNPTGARFTLELPLTIAIIKALLVKVAGRIFALPFADIARSVSINPSDIKTLGGEEVAIIDQEDVPLLRLDKIFNLGGSPNPAPSAPASVTAVMVERGDDVAALTVDGLVNKEELIVKPLAPILRQSKGFSGSAILGNGETILIIDVANILEISKKSKIKL